MKENKEVAIIGMACRFPKASNYEEFWENLKNGESGVQEVPPERWDWEQYWGEPKREKNKSNCKWGGFIDHAEMFDATFFGLSPREVEVMDPQQRIMLELSWACLEDAGIRPSLLSNRKIGVFLGVFNFDYKELQERNITHTIEAHHSTGTAAAVIANRISWFFNLKGPSVAVDTACSGSLHAIHQAVQSLRLKECEMILAGGINLLLTPTRHISFSKTGMLSPSGSSKSFSEHADGYIRSEGAGLILLKPMETALKDGNNILGILKGSAANHCGKTHTLTYPNPDAQAEVIVDAMKNAETTPERISYIETHGTGTPKGDPIEFQGLNQAFQQWSNDEEQENSKPWCYLGSVKSNIGHAEAAAGVAGVMKVLLSMKHKTLPKLQNFREMNHRIPIEKSPFQVVEQTQEWPQPLEKEGQPTPRRAGVSSFGFGGTNAHVILEEPPATKTVPAEDRPCYLVALSAKTKEALRQKMEQLSQWIDQKGERYHLSQICSTLLLGRDHFDCRAALVVKNREALQNSLKAILSDEKPENYFEADLTGMEPEEKEQLEYSGQLTIEQYEQELTTLAGLYCEGYDKKWPFLDSDQNSPVVPLPTYPFAKERHWLPKAMAEKQETIEKKAEDPYEMMTFEEVWREQPVESSDSNRKIGTLVVFLSNPENQQIARQQLEQQTLTKNIIFVAQGETFQKESPTRYSVNAFDKDGYGETFRQIQKDHQTIDSILYLWGGEDSEIVQSHTPVVCTLQALHATGLKVDLLLLSATFENELDICYPESWIGFERSLGLVLPHISVSVLIHHQPNQDGSNQHFKEWMEQLSTELKTKKPESVLYLSGKRFTNQLQQSKLEQKTTQLKARCTWLITGGMGGLGFLFAKHFANKYSANLILTGRSSINETIRSKIKRLERAGGQVLYVEADVCDAEAMRAGIKQAKDRFGTISGVIHAAGIEGTKTLPENEIATFQQIIRPKIEGTITLEQVLRDEPIDYLCHFSSSSAILGDFGSCDYSIGNRFQMAWGMAQADRQNVKGSSRKSIVINWPLWRDGGIGIGDEETTEMYLKSSGQRFLEAEEGTAMFERLLAHGKPQQLVLIGQPNRIERFTGINRQQDNAQSTTKEDIPARPTGKGRRKEMKGLTIPQCLEWDLKELAGEVLRTDREKINPKENLGSFGFDSIILSDFATCLTEHFETEVTPALFFTHTTIEKLTQFFLTEHNRKVRDFYHEEISRSGEIENPEKLKKAILQKSKREKERSKIDFEPIAITGMSGRFPEAKNIREMWKILESGIDVVQEVPKNRLDWKEYSGTRIGTIPGVAEFDPRFFEIAPSEAETMDPRQRLLLQESWKALEDAGYGTKQLKQQSIGVFVGVEEGDYQQISNDTDITANHSGILAARLSYFLDLSGPSMAINTACSSGLVAAHQACQSIRTGECDAAIAAGVNLLLTPHLYRGMNEAGMLSKDGKCYTFDTKANGMVPGEAVAVVVLKRLSLAKSDQDAIYAVIQGSGINYDGKTNGITAPGGKAQTELLKKIYSQYQIDPEKIEYIVTHGTGTKLGDPVEINALYDAFKEYTEKQNFCALTSTKTNFGHTLAASGLVSLISLVQSMRHNTIPASLHCEQENDYINWKKSPFHVNKANKQWPRNSTRQRFGAVSAFGMSGTNAHMVISDYQNEEHPQSEKQTAPYLLVLSAKTAETLREKIDDMINFITLENPGEQTLNRISRTLLEGRHHFRHRCAIVINDLEEALYLWKRIENREQPPNLFQGIVPKNFTAQSALQGWIDSLTEKNRENTLALADLYCQGYEFSPAILFSAERPKHIHLPTYPFAKTEYWAQSEKAPEIAQSVSVVPTGATENTENSQLMTFEEVWKEQEIQRHSQNKSKRTTLCLLSDPEAQRIVSETFCSAHAENEVIFIEQSQDPKLFETIHKELETADDLLYLWPLEDAALIRDYSPIIHLLQAVGKSKRKVGRVLLAAQFDNALDSCWPESWIGLERSIGLVLPGTTVNVIAQQLETASNTIDWTDWAEKLQAELHAEKKSSAFYLNGKRHICQILPVKTKPGTSQPKQNGTWLITGGCGGLGQLFAEHLAATKQANLILTGRSPLNREKESKIEALKKQGAQVLYLQADVCDSEAMRSGLEQAKERFGTINGVIHAAGVESEQTILEKSAEAFQQIINPKIEGTLVLDSLLREEPIDLFCCFSSSSAILGDFGSCDYAVGNRFQMGWANAWNKQQSSGKAVVINWPLWREGGMGVENTENAKMYLNSSGQRFLEKEEGIAIFETLLTQEKTQHLVLTGQPDRIHQFLGLSNPVPVKTEAVSPIHANKATKPAVHSNSKTKIKQVEGEELADCLERDLKNLIEQLLKIPQDQIHMDDNLSEFGFNSINLARFAESLTDHFGVEVTPSLFFGRSTPEKLIEYFLIEHPETIAALYQKEMETEEIEKEVGTGKNPKTISPFYQEQTAEVKSNTQTPSTEFSQTSNLTSQTSENLRIAIIGMSGRFPQAETVDAMWKILTDGINTVDEIPTDRFDWRDYYGDPMAEPGTINTKWSGLLSGVQEFDPLFFEISPIEAKTMDPRQRLLLQESWNALENAGYGSTQIKNSKIGMFVGAEEGEYQALVGSENTVTANHNGILAARLAYFLDFSGPAMAINTACSSGLVAAHQACVSLRNGECDTAIAAAVNLLLTPRFYLEMSHAGMLSVDGKCHTFDTKANGMVPGEAVAAIVLKPLAQAEQDRDPIHAVIKASGINYDGKTNGITAPNGVAQAKLLKETYEQYQINPEEIEYVVTHGTGTKLGDPVEINALYEVFKGYTKKEGFCSLTSTKTNFGHTLSASGLVSLISLVQAIRHQTIPASLHCDQENDYIRWEKSPFRVNKTTKPWPKKEGEPRTGAVSAFGMSGTNAHMVIQGYNENNQNRFENKQVPCFPLALSAKTPEALQEKINQMSELLQNEKQDLLQISQTLLTGRQHFNHRCVVVARNRAEALQGWKLALAGKKASNLFTGETPRDFKGQKMLIEYMAELLKQSQTTIENENRYREILLALSDLHCQGYQVPWNRLYETINPCRIHLPGYPFAKESYWIDTTEKRNTSAKQNGSASTGYKQLHPLLHENRSGFAVQRFSATFTGEEFFLADHKVHGKKVLPGVAYTEMIRKAVELSMDIPEKSEITVRLKNIAWYQPFVVGNEPKNIFVELIPNEQGTINFELYSEQVNGKQKKIVHCQGTALSEKREIAPMLDIDAIKNQCDQALLKSDQYYEAFRVMGLDYGPGFQGIESVQVGERQLLAKLTLLPPVLPTQSQYILHPTLMDAALQASIGTLLIAKDKNGKEKEEQLTASVPFALEELEIFGPCEANMWSLLRFSENQTGESHQKYDIDLFDSKGVIRVQIKGLTFRKFEKPTTTSKPDKQKTEPDSLAANSYRQEIEEIHDDFYRDLLKQVAVGEISEMDFEQLILQKESS